MDIKKRFWRFINIADKKGLFPKLKRFWFSDRKFYKKRANPSHMVKSKNLSGLKGKKLSKNISLERKMVHSLIKGHKKILEAIGRL